MQENSVFCSVKGKFRTKKTPPTITASGEEVLTMSLEVARSRAVALGLLESSVKTSSSLLGVLSPSARRLDARKERLANNH